MAKKTKTASAASTKPMSDPPKDGPTSRKRASIVSREDAADRSRKNNRRKRGSGNGNYA